NAIDARAIVGMCSALGQQSMVMDAIRAGAMDFIVKPFDSGRVIQALDKIS
ncbi:MAG: two-component system response regulator, partial [Pisciglobus halotolerans]|nr:two-component system response regulator [Pisciglobus halotolerans]